MGRLQNDTNTKAIRMNHNVNNECCTATACQSPLTLSAIKLCVSTSWQLFPLLLSSTQALSELLSFIYIGCPNKTIILILWIRKLPPLEACPFSQDIDLACPVLDLGGFSGDGLGHRYLVLRCSTSTKFTCNTSPTWKSATSKAILFRRKYFQVLPEGCN